MNPPHVLSLVLFACLLLVGCEPQKATPTATEAPEPVAAQEPIPTQEPAPAPAPTPTVEPTPIVEPTPEVTSTPVVKAPKPKPKPKRKPKPPEKDAFHKLIDQRGRVIDVRILHVDGDIAYIRRKDGDDFACQAALLNASSRELVSAWEQHYAHEITPEQLAYLQGGGSDTSEEVYPTNHSSSGEKLPYLKKPDSRAKWKLVDDFSDEFNVDEINEQKWFHRMRPWGERAWSADNVWQKDGRLFVQARYEPHTDWRGNEFFYKLGIIQSRKKTTYGYFEARLKGCSRFPGLCPAFWLYSNGREKNHNYPQVTYSEIDIIELQQGGYNMEKNKKDGVTYIDLNLHCRIIKDGKEIWQRPNSLPEVCRHGWEAPWDPRDDFHIYAVENTPETITWYIDGKKVAEEKNLYWHLPMNLTFTMELRPPLIRWAGVDGREPVPENSTPKGFPTHMEVDYVRSWVRAE